MVVVLSSMAMVVVLYRFCLARDLASNSAFEGCVERKAVQQLLALVVVVVWHCQLASKTHDVELLCDDVCVVAAGV